MLVCRDAMVVGYRLFGAGLLHKGNTLLAERYLIIGWLA
jgi:hypothetical protein